MKLLAEGLKKLPNNLQHLEIYFNGNNIGLDQDNLKYLGNAINFLPNGLLYLELDLSENNI